MKVPNFKEKIKLYLDANPRITHDQVGVLLLIENLYNEIPKDVSKFRELYTHLDPYIIENSAKGINFLKLVKSKKSESEIKKELNHYINVKYNYLGNYLSYAENMKRFKRQSKIISILIDEILNKAKFPREVQKKLGESPEIRKCHDFYELLTLYKKTKSKRIKFEILRKIGLIVLLARINRKYLINDIEFFIKEVNDVFEKGLGLKRKSKQSYYLWIDENSNVNYCSSKERSKKLYDDAVKKRNKNALKIYPIQKFEYMPFQTRFGDNILYMEVRNKLQKDNKINYTSFVEKIVRKNLEFPNQVHDLIGVKLIVKSEDDIPKCIRNLEIFLGGSSTRKQEKNTLHKFGKRKLSVYSSKDYYVWKAIYDIALPHPSILKVNKMLKLTKGNPEAQRELNKRLNYFKHRPQDFVVEVQIQDINSYLLSIAEGSSTDHDLLKMNQIRTNSFFKFFPKEIYEKELKSLRNDILKKE